MIPQQQALIAGMGTGEVVLAFCLTEKSGGTGRDTHSRAERDGDEWLLTGEKHLITFADRADLFVLVVASDDRRAKDSLTAFLVPRDTPGFEVDATQRTMGLHGTGHAWLRYDRMRVPDSARLGAGRSGARGGAQLPRLQPRLAVQLHGRAWPSGPSTRRWPSPSSARRSASPIADRQAIQAHLADMHADVARRSRPRAGRRRALPGRRGLHRRGGHGQALLHEHGRPGDRPARSGSTAGSGSRPMRPSSGSTATPAASGSRRAPPRSSSWSSPATSSTADNAPGSPQTIVRPPLTLIVWPVMYSARSEQRKATSAGDVARLAETAERDAPLQRLDQLRVVAGHLGQQRCVRRPGAHDVAGRLRPGGLARHGLREADQAGLARRVDGLAGRADPRRVRGDEDEAAAASLEHARAAGRG